MRFPPAVFTTHAKKRCIQRGIDTFRLRRQLLAVPFDESKGKRRWDIPKTDLYVVFRDHNNQRVVITVVQKIKYKDWNWED